MKIPRSEVAANHSTEIGFPRQDQRDVDGFNNRPMYGRSEIIVVQEKLSFYRLSNAQCIIVAVFFFFFMGGDFSDISDELALIPFFKFRSRMDAMDDRPRWGNSDIAGYVKLIGERFRGC